MKIYVCTKNVPDSTATIRLTDSTTYNEDIPFAMNPSDEFAVEEALKYRENIGQDSQVILVTLGPNNAEAMLRHGLAMGADRAIHVISENQFSDSATTTLGLAKAIEQDGKPDLILTGSWATDTEGMQTPYRLAAYFDLPVITNIIDNCEFQEGRVRIHRELDHGDQEILNIQLPCVLGMKHADEDPRTPKIRDVMKARKKEIQKILLEKLAISPSNTQITLLKLELPPEKPPGKILEGEVQSITHELVRLLREEARVL